MTYGFFYGVIVALSMFSFSSIVAFSCDFFETRMRLQAATGFTKFLSFRRAGDNFVQIYFKTCPSERCAYGMGILGMVRVMVVGSWSDLGVGVSSRRSCMMLYGCVIRALVC